ncbi:hypothetical protein BCON_0001g01180 [Botryotinia convoluta]|uniref:Uncharacterized protein n=1 Tax=Botryotinia convoluta TaxID=54673 RepID=A0A4Z1J2D5_9HELO|nr:hypothetical protein BCON_0001g01180 [Botryotinia convoluta]
MDAHKTSDIYVPQTSSPVLGFFDLPIKIRDDIYQRVLVVPHGIYLFRVYDDAVRTVIPGRPSQWLTSLYANRKMREEASVVFYGRNRFVFMDTMGCQTELLQSFLHSVGPVNASLMSHICISFPIVKSAKDEPGKYALSEDDVYSLKLLRQFTNLTTLETLLYSFNPICATEANQDLHHSRFVQGACSHVDAQLRTTIPRLRKIIIVFHEMVPKNEMADLMRRFRWTVCRIDRNGMVIRQE